LVIFSDFFSTDFDHPDKKVASLAKKGIRTIAVGVSDKVVHTNWMVTGLLQDRNLYLSEKSGDMKRLGQEIKKGFILDGHESNIIGIGMSHPASPPSKVNLVKDACM